MSTSFPSPTATVAEGSSVSSIKEGNVAIAWWSDYLALTKPRIMLMILLTVGVAMLAATRIHGTVVPLSVWFNTLIATGMIAGSASTLNQWFERERDALMPRTQKRPLPSGRLTSFEAALFGWLLFVVGSVYLWLGSNAEAMVCGLATWAIYCWVYTPMKTISWWNTAVGTLPGALPVMIGWTAAGGSLWDVDGWALTAIVKAHPSRSIFAGGVSNVDERGTDGCCRRLACDCACLFVDTVIDCGTSSGFYSDLGRCDLRCSVLFRASGRVASILKGPKQSNSEEAAA